MAIDSAKHIADAKARGADIESQHLIAVMRRELMTAVEILDTLERTGANRATKLDELDAFCSDLAAAARAFSKYFKDNGRG